MAPKELLKRYLDDQCTPEEVEQLMRLFDAAGSADLGMAVYDELEKIEGLAGALNEKQVLDRVYGNLQRTIREQPVKVIPLWKKLVTAASILLAVGAAGYFYYGQDKKITPAYQLVKSAIKPGSNKAYLVLADGKRIELNTEADGVIAKQSGVAIKKASDGVIVYDVSNTNHNQSGSGFNTIETPKGGQYQVKLPDGSLVWLNAASSLKYPVAFAGRSRREVELSGEGYFEVAKDKLHPFVVTTAKESVTVLGTHFNINAYAEEEGSATTLLEGSVRVAAQGSERLIVPGQEAYLTAKSFNITNVDTDEAVAWKNGKFVFQQEDIAGIMRKLSRWYDLEVVYENRIDNKTFTGTVSRFENIQKVLDKITYTAGVHFKIEGRRITVSQ